MSEPRVIFLAGSARSGTGLLQAVFAGSRDTHPALHDCHYLFRQMEIYAAWKQGMLGNGFEQDGFIADYFGDPTTFDSFTAELLRRILDSARSVNSIPSTLVLKCPQLTPHLYNLASLLPEALMVVMVRHPYDIMASLRVVGAKRQAAGLPTRLSGRKSIAELAQQVDASYEELMRQASSPVFAGRLHFVLYEKLVLNTSAVVSELEKFTGLSFDGYDPGASWNSLIDYEQRAVSPVLAPFATPLYDRPISAESVGAHRRVFDAEELAALPTLPCKCLEWFGYENYAFPAPDAESKQA